GLGGAAGLAVLLSSLDPSPRFALALYAMSSLVGAVLVPQFWLLTGQLFTASQGERLFAPIASGATVGGVVGAGIAALALRAFPGTTLLPLAAALFAGAAALVSRVAVRGAVDSKGQAGEAAPIRIAVFRENPLLLGVAGLVALSTSAVLVVDYLFKSTAARMVGAEGLGAFFADCHAGLNALSLLVQLLVASRLVRRRGV